MSTKVSVLVEIPDGLELACDEMRPVTDGESYLTCCGSICVWEGASSRCEYVIVRKAWAWPEWCTAKEIKWTGTEWARFCDGQGMKMSWSMVGLDFTPPPDKSKVYRNPNWKEQ